MTVFQPKKSELAKGLNYKKKLGKELKMSSLCHVRAKLA